MIFFDSRFSVAQVARAARAIDARIVATRDGNHMIVPRGTKAHTNINVVHMPHRKGQYTVPDGAEVA